ncbi:hypothetical protein C5167_018576, partial [Papaver somniferum]
KTQRGQGRVMILMSVVTAGIRKASKTKEAVTNYWTMFSAITYNTLIHQYCKGGDVEKALQFYFKMVSGSFKSDFRTFMIKIFLICGHTIFTYIYVFTAE